MKTKKVCVFLFFVVLTISGIVLLTHNKKENFQNTFDEEENTFFAIYVDDIIASSIPKKDSGYTLDAEKSSCNNGVTISWDLNNWKALLNLTGYVEQNSSRTKCSLYFKEASAYDDCVADYGSDNPQCSIIASLDTTGACPTVNDDGTVNVTGAESENGYVCSATDDYGTSYYYRGNVTNNYVKFAGFYWRIIRINGDGSIRMIYAGDASVLDALDDATKETVMANGYYDSGTLYTQIGTSAYNSSYIDNAYVGYMYGTPGSSTYEETHANINSSTIKTTIDSWYESNIKGTEYESYLSDTLFCNDRSISPYQPSSSYLNTGIGTDYTAYRWYYGPWSTNVNYPRLTCVQQNDRFTVNDTTLGNGALTYPIGLITMDEASLAGGYNVSNSGYYLYAGIDIRTMTPVAFEGNTYGGIIYQTGRLFDLVVLDGAAIPPVLNLKSGTLTSGTGMWNNPYMVD